MCQFCSEKGFIPINNTVEYSGLEICVNRLGLIRVRNYNFKDIFETQDIAKINCCPMCGRRLGDD